MSFTLALKIFDPAPKNASLVSGHRFSDAANPPKEAAPLGAAIPTISGTSTYRRTQR